MGIGHQESGKELLEKGNELYNLGKYEEAIECLDKALEINQKYDLVWINKGLTLYRMGRHEEAQICFDKALRIDPKDEDAKRAREELAQKIKKLRDQEKTLSVGLNFPEKMEYGIDYKLPIKLENGASVDIQELSVDFSEVSEYFECAQKEINFPKLKPEMWLEKDVILKPKFKGVVKFGVSIKSNLDEVKRDFKVEIFGK